MEIGQTLEQLRTLRRDIDFLNKALAGARETTSVGRNAKRLSASVFVEGIGDTRIDVDRGTAIKMLEETKAAKQATIDRLQPVVDMANAALRGLTP